MRRLSLEPRSEGGFTAEVRCGAVYKERDVRQGRIGMESASLQAKAILLFSSGPLNAVTISQVTEQFRFARLKHEFSFRIPGQVVAILDIWHLAECVRLSII